jgi:hypothetical protein
MINPGVHSVPATDMDVFVLQKVGHGLMWTMIIQKHKLLCNFRDCTRFPCIPTLLFVSSML